MAVQRPAYTHHTASAKSQSSPDMATQQRSSHTWPTPPSGSGFQNDQDNNTIEQQSSSVESSYEMWKMRRDDTTSGQKPSWRRGTRDKTPLPSDEVAKELENMRKRRRSAQAYRELSDSQQRLVDGLLEDKNRSERDENAIWSFGHIEVPDPKQRKDPKGVMYVIVQRQDARRGSGASRYSKAEQKRLNSINLPTHARPTHFQPEPAGAHEAKFDPQRQQGAYLPEVHLGTSTRTDPTGMEGRHGGPYSTPPYQTRPGNARESVGLGISHIEQRRPARSAMYQASPIHTPPFKPTGGENIHVSEQGPFHAMPLGQGLHTPQSSVFDQKEVEEQYAGDSSPSSSVQDESWPNSGQRTPVIHVPHSRSFCEEFYAEARPKVDHHRPRGSSAQGGSRYDHGYTVREPAQARQWSSPESSHEQKPRSRKQKTARSPQIHQQPGRGDGRDRLDSAQTHHQRRGHDDDHGHLSSSQSRHHDDRGKRRDYSPSSPSSGSDSDKYFMKSRKARSPSPSSQEHRRRDSHRGRHSNRHEKGDEHRRSPPPRRGTVEDKGAHRYRRGPSPIRSSRVEHHEDGTDTDEVRESFERQAKQTASLRKEAKRMEQHIRDGKWDRDRQRRHYED